MELIVFVVVLFLVFVAFFSKSAPYAANPTTAPGGVAGSVAWSGCGCLLMAALGAIAAMAILSAFGINSITIK